MFVSRQSAVFAYLQRGKAKKPVCELYLGTFERLPDEFVAQYSRCVATCMRELAAASEMVHGGKVARHDLKRG